METAICTKCKKEKKIDNFSKRKNRKKEIMSECRDCHNVRRKKKRKENKEWRDEQNKKGREYRASHKEERSKYNKEYSKKNKQRRAKRIRIRKKNDPNFRLRTMLSLRITSALKQQATNKSLKTMDLLGCSMNFFMTYIEKQFDDNMNWENYGRYGWHIDHIKPCAMFDLTNIEQQKICFHYTNLRPLWWSDNIKKSSKYNGKRF